MYVCEQSSKCAFRDAFWVGKPFKCPSPTPKPCSSPDRPTRMADFSGDRGAQDAQPSCGCYPHRSSTPRARFGCACGSSEGRVRCDRDRCLLCLGRSRLGEAHPIVEVRPSVVGVALHLVRRLLEERASHGVLLVPAENAREAGALSCAMQHLAPNALSSWTHPAQGGRRPVGRCRLPARAL
eukprot:6181225-Pleurochrysis_carterae.AAC.2